MSNVKRIAWLAMLSMLLPASAMAAKSKSSAGESASAAESIPAQPSPSVPLPVGDGRCDMLARFNATYWYKATWCARRHKAMRTQEEKIKKLIARTYPGLHRAIMTAPYGPFGRTAIDDSPYNPDTSPFLDKASCKENFGFLMRDIKDAKTRQTILKCWEQPREAATGKPVSPLNDRVCVGTGQYMASAWYRADMCTARHKELEGQTAKLKAQITASLPAFQKAISTRPLLDAGKFMATYSMAKSARDPNLTKEACEANLNFLAMSLKQNEWSNSIQQCWGKSPGKTASAAETSAATQ